LKLFYADNTYQLILFIISEIHMNMNVRNKVFMAFFF